MSPLNSIFKAGGISQKGSMVCEEQPNGPEHSVDLLEEFILFGKANTVQTGTHFFQFG